MFSFTLSVEGLKNGIVSIVVKHDENKALVKLDSSTKEIRFSGDKQLITILQNNSAQFIKVIGAGKPETFYPGFSLNFALSNGKDIAAFNDLTNILVINRKNGKNQSFAIKKGKEKIIEMFIDGSYRRNSESSGYAVILKNPEGEYKLLTFKSELKNSSLIELQAAIKGLEILSNQTEIRIISDSQYVRKGLTEWIHNWKLNNWYTAEGKRVKNISYWKKFDALAENKYIEFRYVKGHSGHFENTMADLYARDMASGLDKG